MSCRDINPRATLLQDQLSLEQLDKLLRIALQANHAFTHDFLSTTSAIDNGLELLEMALSSDDLDAARQALGLIREISPSLSQMTVKQLPRYGERQVLFRFSPKQEIANWKVEFGDQVDFSLDIADESPVDFVYPSNVASFIVAELVRNGKRHGKSGGKINVKISVRDNCLNFFVTNEVDEPYPLPKRFTPVSALMQSRLDIPNAFPVRDERENAGKRGLSVIERISNVSSGKFLARRADTDSVYEFLTVLPVLGYWRDDRFFGVEN